MKYWKKTNSVYFFLPVRLWFDNCRPSIVIWWRKMDGIVPGGKNVFTWGLKCWAIVSGQPIARLFRTCATQLITTATLLQSKAFPLRMKEGRKKKSSSRNGMLWTGRKVSLSGLWSVNGGKTRQVRAGFAARWCVLWTHLRLDPTCVRNDLNLSERSCCTCKLLCAQVSSAAGPCKQWPFCHHVSHFEMTSIKPL